MSTVSTSVSVETQKGGRGTEKIIPKDFCCLGFVVYFVCFSNLMKASNVQILINRNIVKIITHILSETICTKDQLKHI